MLACRLTYLQCLLLAATSGLTGSESELSVTSWTVAGLEADRQCWPGAMYVPPDPTTGAKLPDVSMDTASAWIGLYSRRQYFKYTGCVSFQNLGVAAYDYLPDDSAIINPLECLKRCRTRNREIELIGLQIFNKACYCIVTELDAFPYTSLIDTTCNMPCDSGPGAVAVCGGVESVSLYEPVEEEGTSGGDDPGFPVACVSVGMADGQLSFNDTSCSPGPRTAACEGMPDKVTDKIRISSTVPQPDWQSGASTCFSQSLRMSKIDPETAEDYIFGDTFPRKQNVWTATVSFIDVIAARSGVQVQKFSPTSCGYLTFKTRTGQGQPQLRFSSCQDRRPVLCVGMPSTIPVVPTTDHDQKQEQTQPVVSSTAATPPGTESRGIITTPHDMEPASDHTTLVVTLVVVLIGLLFISVAIAATVVCYRRRCRQEDKDCDVTSQLQPYDNVGMDVLDERQASGAEYAYATNGDTGRTPDGHVTGNHTYEDAGLDSDNDAKKVVSQTSKHLYDRGNSHDLDTYNRITDNKRERQPTTDNIYNRANFDQEDDVYNRADVRGGEGVTVKRAVPTDNVYDKLGRADDVYDRTCRTPNKLNERQACNGDVYSTGAHVSTT